MLSRTFEDEISGYVEKLAPKKYDRVYGGPALNHNIEIIGGRAYSINETKNDVRKQSSNNVQTV